MATLCLRRVGIVVIGVWASRPRGSWSPTRASNRAFKIAEILTSKLIVMVSCLRFLMNRKKILYCKFDYLSVNIIQTNNLIITREYQSASRVRCSPTAREPSIRYDVYARCCNLLSCSASNSVWVTNFVALQTAFCISGIWTANRALQPNA